MKGPEMTTTAVTPAQLVKLIRKSTTVTVVVEGQAHEITMANLAMSGHGVGMGGCKYWLTVGDVKLELSPRGRVEVQA